MTADLDEELLDRAAGGDAAASHALLDRHRSRLKRMLRVRLDDRLSARLDDSDLVQETLAEAALRLPEYLARRPIPFYPWLRQLAGQKLVDARRHHGRGRRSLEREHPGGLPDRSAVELARRLVCPSSGPGRSVERRGVQRRVRDALAALDEADREVLVLCHLERLSVPEAAAVLGMNVEATKSRRRRAVLRLTELLRDLRKDLGG